MTARDVRLTALTEAGGRGPWSNAAEINLLAGVPGNDPTYGIWSGAIGFPLVPAAAAQLPNGKLLTWSAYHPGSFVGGTGQTQTAILDPATSAVSQRTVTETGHDMFCPGTAMLPDGRVQVTGGNDSGKTASTPANDTWTTGPTMTIPRGYHGRRRCPMVGYSPWAARGAAGWAGRTAKCGRRALVGSGWRAFRSRRS